MENPTKSIELNVGETRALLDVKVGAATDVGLKRTTNEDRFRVDSTTGLFLVVDGVGGQIGGSMASETVASSIHKFIQDTKGQDDRTWPFGIDLALSHTGNRLRAAVLMANQTIAAQIGRDPSLAGMAATLAALLLWEGKAVVASVGDCRAYLFRDDTLTQITVDHSWVAERVREGRLSEADVRDHPLRNMVTRAVAGREELDIDVIEFEYQADDTFLLCSDGLTGMVSDAEISSGLLESRGDPGAAVEKFLNAANAAGGRDNVTVVVVTTLG